MPPSITLVSLGLAVLVGLALVARARSFLVVAQPDQWLLCIRNGKLVKAGIGIYSWRRPGDVVARFTSTMQRVGFSVSGLSKERLRVVIDGFILWSISGAGDGPFRAFQKLGVVNLDAHPFGLTSPKHLLSTAQHRAFQQLLGAVVQRLTTTQSLDDLLLRQDTLVTELRGELARFEADIGIRIDEVEILKVRPEDEALLGQMSAGVEERVREEAAAARKRDLDREQALRLMQLEHERELKGREQDVLREQAVAALQREELELAARLDRIRREAEANRDAMSAVASAEELKSQGVRDYELGKLVAEKGGDALKELPLKEARWVTVGQDSPVSSLAALLTTARELTTKASQAA